MIDLLAAAAATWGIAMAAAPLLQIRRMRRTGSSADLSLGYLGVLQVGFVLWLSYGLALRNPALIVANVASLGFGLTTLTIAWRMRRTATPD